MTRRIVHLAKRRVEPNAEVVELARGVLRQALAGELRALAVAAVHVGRADGTAYALGDADVAHLNLALDRVKARILREGEG